MASSKWLLKLTRNCANWNAAQRQIQQKQLLVPQETFIEYQNSLSAVVEKGFTNLRFSPELCDRLKKLTDYNVVSGKQLRGLLTISACQSLIKPEINDELQQKIFALAWATEMFQSYFLMTDDMEDGAKTRRGKICWHLLPDVGAYAINDVGMFRTFISEILWFYFNTEPVYPKIINFFNEAYFKTHVGQFIDTTLCMNKDYSNFTMEKYINTVKYKTAFYSYQLPILLALVLSNKESKEAYELVESIGSDLGLLLQMQNDFLDYYDDESVGGKSGTDIQEGKCSWLALTALKHCSLSQHKEFLENYGKWEQESVERIRKLYNELELSKLYRNEEQKLYKSIRKRINNLSTDAVLPGDIFHRLVNTVYSVGNIDYK